MFGVKRCFIFLVFFLVSESWKSSALLSQVHLIILFFNFYSSFFMNIFVAQLNFKIQSESLKQIFEEYGTVTSAKVINDQVTGRSKGFGFVEMADDNEALHAIEELNGAEVEGKTIVVKKANPRPEGGSGNGGGRRDFRSGGGRPQRRFDNRD